MSHAFFQRIFPTHLAYRNFIFVPLFFAFYIVLKVFEPSSLSLLHFTNRPISIATYEGIDIGLRVNLFYKAIGFALVLFVLFTRLTIVIKRYVNEAELRIANSLSLAGFCLLFFELLGAEMDGSMHFIFAVLIICFSGLVYHQVKRREQKDFVTVMLWSTLMAMSLFFIQWQILNFAGIKSIVPLPTFVAIAGVILYLLFTNSLTLSYSLIKASQPFALVPFISFVSVELYMILNQHGIYFSPRIIYVLGVLIILTSCVLRYRKYRNNNSPGAYLPIFFRNWIPWMLAGIVCVTFYSPVVKPEIDWFEDANHLLPLQQLFSFGKIPFLDSFNSHALADYGFGIFYSLLNGADPMGVYVYGFMMGVIVIIAVYFLIYKITGDGFLAIWLAFAYPYVDLLIPYYYNLVPLAALSFVLLYEKQSVWRYTFFFCMLLFMLLWRIDLGSSTLVAGVLSLLILFFFVPTFQVDRKNLVKGLLYSVAAGCVLLIMALIHSGSHVFVSLKDALNYISSFQSYGLRDLDGIHDAKYFSLYFIFPAVILLTLIYFVYNLIRRRYSGHSVLYVLALIFFGIFYLSNLQRGLVRHTLAENWDAALTSFGFFIISSIAYINLRNASYFIRFFVFFIVSTIVVSNYTLREPELSRNNTYSYLYKKLTSPSSIIYSKEKIERITADPSWAANSNEFSQWMKNNFSGKSTFLDFSNTPMLYYFSNRAVPNFFDQIPHTAHNEYLQNRFIEDLENYDIPVTVFSNSPNTFWDYLDGIPNTLRHYRISEYIYRNYKPAFIINHHSVWLKKNFNPGEKETELLFASIGDMTLSGVELTEGNRIHVTGERGVLNYHLDSALPFSNKKVYLLTHVTSATKGEIIVRYKSSLGKFNDKQKAVYKINEGLNTLFLMMESLENDHDLGDISFDMSYGMIANFSTTKIVSSDYYRDYVSRQPAEYQLKFIPYFWGTFDKNFLAGNIKLEKNIFSGDTGIQSMKETTFGFEPVKDKELGNYVHVNVKNTSGKQNDLTLRYGENNSMNGAFTFALKEDTLYHDYLVRISSQYNWYCRDNYWLSMYPSQTNVELKKVEILKGD